MTSEELKIKTYYESLDISESKTVFYLHTPDCLGGNFAALTRFLYSCEDGEEQGVTGKRNKDFLD